MKRRILSGLIVVYLTASALLAPLESHAAGEAEVIGSIAADIGAGRITELGEARIAADSFITDFYAGRDGRPAWFGTPSARSLLVELDQALHQGFTPADFHMPLLFDLHERAEMGDAEDIATFDIVATDAAARLIHHLIYGKVDPEAMDPNWNFARPVIERDMAEVFNTYLDGDGFSAMMDKIAIDDRQYLLLVDALNLYREIDARGGWPMVPEGQALKPEMEDERVPVLRERLAAEGDYTPIGATGNVYDLDLAVALERFQKRHGLTADGVIGPKTLVSLNKTAAERVDQLRLSLERFRWFVRELEDDFVLVNIGGARLILVVNDQVVWSTKTITGSGYRQTPVFRDDIKYMEFNPTWSVPYSIFKKDKLARIRKDRGYLERGNYVVRNKSGQVIPASSVNWNSDNPGVSLMQKPGSGNALGLVKFMFPNEHAVYLHDTNDRSLFERDERNLSSGCVRVQDPFVFAGLLMQDDPSWSQKRMQSILDSGKTTRVNLPEPMPVMLTYWTAWVEDDGVHFREDPYDRDARVLKALNAEF